MIELVHLEEMNKVRMFPSEVQNNIQSILIILDGAYGEDRDKNDDGGYVIVVEEKDDFEFIVSVKKSTTTKHIKLPVKMKINSF